MRVIGIRASEFDRPSTIGPLGRRVLRVGACHNYLGVGIKGTLGDIDPLNKVPLKRSRSRVLYGVSLILPRNSRPASRTSPTGRFPAHPANECSAGEAPT